MADSANGFMSAGYGFQAVADIAGAYAQSEAIKAQASFQKKMVEINSRFAAERGKDALKAGEQQSRQIRRRANQTIGAQRAAAAQGLDVNEGTIVEQVADTQSASENEIINARNNAWREAWGYKTQSTLNMIEADSKVKAAKFMSQQTLLTGGFAAASSIGRSAVYANKQFADSNPSKSDDKVEGFSGTWLKSDLAKRNRDNKSVFGVPSLFGEDY